MAASPVPRIIVLALGAGALGFPDALRVLLDIAGRRGPLTDIAICVLAIAVVTAQALGTMLLARLVRKSGERAGGDAHAPGVTPTPPRTDRFAKVTLVVSLGVAFLVSACLLVASGAGAGARGLLGLVVADVVQKMKSPVIAALATATATATAAAVLHRARPLLCVFRREEDHSHGAAAASGSAATGRFAGMALMASFTGAATFLLAVSRKARNAAGAGGHAARASVAGTRRIDGKLTRLAPYLAVVSFAVICLVVTSLTAPRTHDSA